MTQVLHKIGDVKYTSKNQNDNYLYVDHAGLIQPQVVWKLSYSFEIMVQNNIGIKEWEGSQKLNFQDNNYLIVVTLNLINILLQLNMNYCQGALVAMF